VMDQCPMREHSRLKREQRTAITRRVRQTAAVRIKITTPTACESNHRNGVQKAPFVEKSFVVQKRWLTTNTKASSRGILPLGFQTSRLLNESNGNAPNHHRQRRV